MNRICELLGIRYPIIQGGMAHVATGALAAAVSEAGGLGILGTGHASKEWIKAEIAKIRDITQKPFGVNIAMFSPNVRDVVDVVVEEGVAVVTTGGGSPMPYIKALKEAGAKFIPVVPNARLAKKMEDAGADAIVAEGTEAGGHVSNRMTSIVLIPAVRDAVKIPVIAAGGIADARGVVAAFALGADAVQMGTRFLCSTECIVHPKYKKAIVEAQDDCTVVTGIALGNPLRSLANQFSRQFYEMERSGASPEELERMGVGRYRKAAIEGDVENGTVLAGQVACLIGSEKSVKDLLSDIIKHAGVVMESLNGAIQEFIRT